MGAHERREAAPQWHAHATGEGGREGQDGDTGWEEERAKEPAADRRISPVNLIEVRTFPLSPNFFNHSTPCGKPPYPFTGGVGK